MPVIMPWTAPEMGIFDLVRIYLGIDLKVPLTLTLGSRIEGHEGADRWIRDGAQGSHYASRPHHPVETKFKFR